MENTYYYSRRQRQTPSPSPPPSSRLVRSRSGSSAATRVGATSPAGVVNSGGCHRTLSKVRSKSTTKARPYNYHNNNNNNKASSSPQLISAYSSSILVPTCPTTSQNKSNNSNNNDNNKAQEYGRGFAAKFLPRGGGKSAWALSPGRSLQLGADSGVGVGPTRGNNNNKAGGGGVLKYFRQKKVAGSTAEEEEFHKLRMLVNRVMQWRFANARAHLSISATHFNAQNKLFSVWIRIFMMRNSIVEKRIQMQRLKCEIKVYEILNPQILLLNEWAKLEKKNIESVGKLVMKLSGVSVRLPLIHGAKVTDVMSVYEAISEAVIAMDGIEEIITTFYKQVESILYMVTELLITNKQHKENLAELEKSVTWVSTLVIEN